MVLIDGSSLITDPYALILLFEKMDGQWKVTYTNESTVITTIAADSASVDSQ